MLVALIEDTLVIGINEYPTITSIDEIKHNFTEEITLLEVTDIDIPEYNSTRSFLEYIDGKFIVREKEITINQPTNAEVAQMISDLQADLIIAGVI